MLSKVNFLDISSWPNDLKELYNFAVSDVAALIHFAIPLKNAGMTELDELKEFKDCKMHYGPKLSGLKKSSREFWPWAYQIDSHKYKHFFLIVELIMVIPFSTAVAERGFSAVRRIPTYWRSTLAAPLVADCLRFCSRKSELDSQSFRHKLIERSSTTYLDGTEKENDYLGTLTKRRINKILNGIEKTKDVEERNELYFR